MNLLHWFSTLFFFCWLTTPAWGSNALRPLTLLKSNLSTPEQLAPASFSVKHPKLSSGADSTPNLQPTWAQNFHKPANLLIANLPIADTVATKQETDPFCNQPALARLQRHTVAPGETLAALAQRYNLLPATLMGMNPILQGGQAPVGAEIVIPPFNGIRVEVRPGQTWRDVASAYNVRADVLFEVNGCQQEPRFVFVPGVNWVPGGVATRNSARSQAQTNHDLRGYPLGNIAPVVRDYGWRLDPTVGEVVFNSGVALAAEEGTSVLAVGDGTVAFAGAQETYGNLVVINHRQGLQTRYAQLANISVRVGQTVREGAVLGTVGATGTGDTRLHFEVRSNSDLGWVAQNPRLYIRNLGNLGEQP